MPVTPGSLTSLTVRSARSTVTILTELFLFRNPNTMIKTPSKHPFNGVSILGRKVRMSTVGLFLEFPASYLLMYGSEHTVSNDMVIGERGIGKDVEGSCSGAVCGPIVAFI